MNQRIRELAEQSNLTIATSSLWEHKVQEFAELIVRECVAICHKMAEDSDSYVVHDGDTCAEQIKKHFGVEE
jgi:hypothetical protein